MSSAVKSILYRVHPLGHGGITQGRRKSATEVKSSPHSQLCPAPGPFCFLGAILCINDLVGQAMGTQARSSVHEHSGTRKKDRAPIDVDTPRRRLSRHYIVLYNTILGLIIGADS